MSRLIEDEELDGAQNYEILVMHPSVDKERTVGVYDEVEAFPSGSGRASRSRRESASTNINASSSHRSDRMDKNEEKEQQAAKKQPEAKKQSEKVVEEKVVAPAATRSKSAIFVTRLNNPAPVAKEVPKEAAKEVSKEVPKEVSKEVAKKDAKKAAKEVVKDVTFVKPSNVEAAVEIVTPSTSTCNSNLAQQKEVLHQKKKEFKNINAIASALLLLIQCIKKRKFLITNANSM